MAPMPTMANVRFFSLVVIGIRPSSPVRLDIATVSVARQSLVGVRPDDHGTQATWRGLGQPRPTTCSHRDSKNRPESPNTLTGQYVADRNDQPGGSATPTIAIAICDWTLIGNPRAGTARR
jgi:hypothetical protein